MLLPLLTVCVFDPTALSGDPHGVRTCKLRQLVPVMWIRSTLADWKATGRQLLSHKARFEHTTWHGLESNPGNHDACNHSNNQKVQLSNRKPQFRMKSMYSSKTAHL